MMVVALAASRPRYCGTVRSASIGSAFSKNVRSVIGVACLPDVDQLGGRLVDLLMQRIVEMLRLEERRDAVVRLVVDEDGAEQRLLGLDVVGRLPEVQRLVGAGCGSEAIGGGSECGFCAMDRTLSAGAPFREQLTRPNRSRPGSSYRYAQIRFTRRISACPCPEFELRIKASRAGGSCSSGVRAAGRVAGHHSPAMRVGWASPCSRAARRRSASTM